ncbi:MAG: adenylate/guanylate cyclase domain-containing protein [Alphaproteobacteria bacterium]|nr:MAG: adenylate/guanylate cyclase domain-containing protein [Alphaproteobacteria bacterium]
MTLREELDAHVYGTYSSAWDRRAGRVVPESDDIQLGNQGVDLEAAMIYADLTASTQLVDGYLDWFAAEQYKVFLHCASKIIRAEGGEIRSYDGDRVMGVFVGDMKRTNAVRAALKINWAVNHIINPRLKQRHPNTPYLLSHVVGVDCSNVFGVRAGIRGSNDVAWIGRSANYAAKLSSLKVGSFKTWITRSVYDGMADLAKFGGPSNANMWVEHRWTQMNDFQIYGSTYEWVIT